MVFYIFILCKDIYIIDLKCIVLEIEKVYVVLYDIVKDGGIVLFVGIKK